MGLGWFGLAGSFDGLKARHFIKADRTGVFLEKQTICIQVSLAYQFDLRLKLDWIFLLCIEPVLYLVWLERRFVEVSTDLADRDALYDLSLNDFIGDFPMGPKRD